MRVAHLSLPKDGERSNGDRVVFRQEPDGRTLLGVIDGLGHGPEAEQAALAAVEQLTRAPLDLTMGPLMEQVHASLRGTRGAAATLCLIANGQLEACGVGNVEMRCTETDIPFVFSPGILGGRVRRFRVCTAKAAPATRLVFFSDGIHALGHLVELRKLSPADACKSIFHKHRRGEDDATVLIADLG
jgi:negative regulator of sigma-B (phosphoserine phosphatase)